MRKRTRWLLGGLAIGAGTVSAAAALLKKKKVETPKRVGDVWARPGMPVTFRAELMPVATVTNARSWLRSFSPVEEFHFRA